MRSRFSFRAFVSLSVLCLYTILLSCGTPTNTGPTKCENADDCISGQFCSRGECKEKPKNVAPIAKAGDDQSVKVGQSAQLDGSASFDENGDPLIYTWSIKEKPDGSTAEIKNPDSVKTTLRPDKEGRYVIELVVKDGNNSSDPDEVVITATPGGENAAPTANAGSDQTVKVGDTVQLDGTKSADTDGDTLTYKWTLTPPTGSQAKLSDETNEKPTFVADIEGAYEVSLTVNDGIVDSQPASIKVTATKDNPDVAPTLTKIDPDKGPANTTVEITLTGTNFVDGAVIVFRSRESATKFVSATELKAQLSLAGATVGKYPLTVKNPNAKTSNPLDFEVIDIPKPTITNLVPASAGQGAKFKLKIEGTGFVQGAVIVFDNIDLTTTVVSDTAIEGDLDLTGFKIDTYNVTVRNPGNSVSDPAVFTVTTPPPPPVIKFINPESGKAGSKIDFTVYGELVSQGAEILFNGKAIKTANPTPQELTADPKLDLTNITGGNYDVQIRNLGGSLSNKVTFTVLDQYPTPLISSISPNQGMTNTTVKISITGKFIDPAAKVIFDGKAVANATYVSSTQINAELDLTGIAVASYNIVVENPGPSGQPPRKSNILPFKVNPLPPPNITVVTGDTRYKNQYGTLIVQGQGFTQNTVVQFSTSGSSSSSTCRSASSGYTFADKTTTFVSPTELRAGFVMPSTTSSTDYWGVRVKRGNDLSNVYCAYVSYSTSTYPTRVPVITTITPAGADLSASPVSVRLSGSYFSRYGTLLFNNKPVTYTYSSSSSITASFDLTGLSASKAYDVQYITSYNVKSKIVQFSVLKTGQPAVSRISPTTAEEGSTLSYLYVYGINYKVNGWVQFGTSTTKHTCDYVTSTYIRCPNVDLSGIPQGKVAVKFFNPGGEAAANTPELTITAPNPPTLSSITPVLGYNNQKYTLTLNGSRLSKATKVLFGTKVLTNTTYVSASRITVELDLNGITKGIYQVKVRNTVAGKDYDSNGQNFTVLDPPTPVITYVSRMNLVRGQTHTLTIYGNDLVATQEVHFDGKPVTIKSKSSSISVELDLTNTTIGAYPLQAIAGPTRKSEIVYIYVDNAPAPTITYINPAGVYQGTTASTTYVYGLNFDPKATLSVGGSTIAPSAITSSRITFSIPFPAQLYPENTPIPIKVTNPGGASDTYNVYAIPTSYTPRITYPYLTKSIYTYSSNTYMSVYGSGLGSYSSSKLYIDGTSYSLYSGYSSYRLRTSSTIAYGNQPKTLKVQVETGGKRSNILEFRVLPRIPTITYVRAPYTKSGTSATIEFVGSNFSTSPKTKVYVGGSVLPDTAVTVSSTSRIAATFTQPAAGSKPVYLLNPDGSKSQLVYLNVTP